MAERPDVDLADWPSERPDEAKLDDAKPDEKVIVTAARGGLTQFSEEPSIFAVVTAPPPRPPVTRAQVPAAPVPPSTRALVTQAAGRRHFRRRSVGLAGLTGVALALLITGGLTWSAARRRTAAAIPARAAVTAPAEGDRVAAAPPSVSPAPAQQASDAPVVSGNLAARPPEPVAPPPSPVVDRPIVRTAPAPIAKPITGTTPAPGEKAPPQTRAASSPSGRADSSNSQPPLPPPPTVPRLDLPQARPLPALNDPVGRPPAAAPPPATVAPPVDAVPRAAAETAPPTPPATVPPAPAPPTPAPPAPAAPVTETGAVESVLARYRDAFNTLDVNKTGLFWPNANTQALARAFDQLETQEFTFDQCAVNVTGATAVATCRGRAAYTPKVGNRTLRVEARQWTFRLEKMNGVWVISRVDSTRG